MKNCVLLVLLVSAFPFGRCHGNLSGPWKPGQMLADVEGVKDISIVRETLRIDLRPLVHGRGIKITATYVIDDPHSPKDLPLTFITGVNSVQGVKCTLNGKTLPYTTKQVRNIPDSWKPPAKTPGFVPDEQLLYNPSITEAQYQWILFTVPLQTGRQSIEVSYEVEAGRYYSEKYTALFWQTAYILAPARTWKSFGGLDVEVLAPETWQVKSNLPLVNQGQQWTASFDSLPADFIALTTVHPNNKRVLVIDTSEMFYFFGMMTLLIGLRHMIRRYRQVKQSGGALDQPPCTQHGSMTVFLLSFLPLVWNVVVIIMFGSVIPSDHANYQLPVIFIFFQAFLWIVPLLVLILLTWPLLWMFCVLGTWLGRPAQKKQNHFVHSI